MRLILRLRSASSRWHCWYFCSSFLPRKLRFRMIEPYILYEIPCLRLRNDLQFNQCLQSLPYIIPPEGGIDLMRPGIFVIIYFNMPSDISIRLICIHHLLVQNYLFSFRPWRDSNLRPRGEQD